MLYLYFYPFLQPDRAWLYVVYMCMYMEQKRFQGKNEDSGISETLPKDLYMSPYCSLSTK